MFNRGFYPSTPEVIELMIAPYIYESGRDYYSGKRVLRAVQRILDPSAGKGDILDYVFGKFELKKENLFCCEIEEELVAILQSKGYKLLERDFLKFSDPYQFDLILANPPFHAGAEHALKMWEALEMFGGEMVVQLNREALDNPCTWERQRLLEIIRENSGEIEYIGQPYKKAERPTDVEVVIVRLKRKASRVGINFDTTGFDRDGRYGDATYSENALVSADRLQALVASYEAARTCLIERAKIDAKFAFYTYGLDSGGYTAPGATKQDMRKNSEEAQKQLEVKNLNGQIADLKRKYWKYLFERTKIADVSTSKVQAQFMKFVDDTSAVAFTYDNVARVFAQLLSESGETMRQCVVDTFDKMCSYDTENRVHSEGWVTNDAYRVNSKVILPVRTRGYDDWGTYYWDSKERAIMDDIDKALCFVNGKQYSEVLTISKVVEGHVDDARWGRKNPYEPIYSEFFRIRIFKKGTIHLWFKDMELWEKFNLMAAQGKNWIGADTQHKHQKKTQQRQRRAQQEYRQHFAENT